MRNFGTLYGFELKKLLGRKMVWIALAVLTAVSVLLPATEVMGSLYVSEDATGQETRVYTHYARNQYARTDPAGLDGRPYDTALIQEALAALGLAQVMTVPAPDGAEMTIQTVRTPAGTADWSMESDVMRRQYWQVLDTAEAVVGAGNVDETLTGDEFYDALARVRTQKYAALGMTAAEMAWWDARSRELETPFPWTGFAEGWHTAVRTAYTVNVLAMLFAAIALAGLWPQERQRRTDALIGCARYGKAPLYAAKFLAGLTVSVGGAAVMLAGMLGACLGLIGPEGFGAAVQQTLTVTYGAPLSIGKLALIAYGLCLAASAVHGAFVMAVSLVTRSGAAAMAVSFGALLLFILVPALPSRWYALGMLWSLLPGILGVAGYLDPRLVRLGGYLTSLQTTPLLWLAMILVLAALAWALHRRVPAR